MSDKNKLKPSKSSYARAAKRQKQYEQQFIDMIQGVDSKKGKESKKNKENRSWKDRFDDEYE